MNKIGMLIVLSAIVVGVSATILNMVEPVTAQTAGSSSSFSTGTSGQNAASGSASAGINGLAISGSGAAGGGFDGSSGGLLADCTPHGGGAALAGACTD
jgi:hypothetical protein